MYFLVNEFSLAEGIFFVIDFQKDIEANTDCYKNIGTMM